MPAARVKGRVRQIARTHTPRRPPAIDPGARQREGKKGFRRKLCLRPPPGDADSARFAESLRRLALCLLLWLHAAGEFFYRRAQLFLSPRAGAVSHPHDDVRQSQAATTPSAVPLWTFSRRDRSGCGRSKSVCPSVWKRLIRSKRTTCSAVYSATRPPLAGPFSKLRAIFGTSVVRVARDTVASCSRPPP